MPVPHHSVFTGRMPFLPPNQQRKALKALGTDENEHIIDDASPDQSSDNDSGHF